MKTQRYGIIGGGILGMTLALRLAQAGHAVTILEAAPVLGGLAASNTLGDVRWDRYYHVTLFSDMHTRTLLEELGIAGDMQWRDVQTGFFIDGALHPFSSAWDFARFPGLGLVDKMRLAATILLASRREEWESLERMHAVDWLARWCGARTVARLWVPLLRAKLGDQWASASAAFIWAIIVRMYAARRAGLRTERFGYMQGGYARTLARFADVLRERGVELALGSPVRGVLAENGSLRVEGAHDTRTFDRVVVTLAASQAAELCPQISEDESRRMRAVRYQGIICPALLLRKPLSPYYITNVVDEQFGFTGIIEMSALVDRAEFGGAALVYLPRYLRPDDPAFECSDQTILAAAIAALRRIHPSVAADDLIASSVSRVRHVFPISTLDYSHALAPMRTSVPGLWTISSAHIVNGTLNVNETVALAERVAGLVASEVA